MDAVPAYIQTAESGKLDDKLSRAARILKSCTLCPRNCGVDRTKNEKGICQSGEALKIYSFGPHFGEEPQISGTKGSGTVFFSHCGLRCCFCQNHEISILGDGLTAEPGQLASIMLQLQEKGCHNINLVTPTHYIPQILAELKIAIDHDLALPIVYNSSGYETVKTLRLLEGIIDIFMPDFKFWDPGMADLCCNAPDYPKAARNAILEMQRQVGDLKINSKNIAVSGLLVRHLVLPDKMAGSKEIFNFLSQNVSKHLHINVMSQYHPEGKARQMKSLNRHILPDEYKEALLYAEQLKLNLIR